MNNTETNSDDVEEILVYAEFEDSVNLEKYNNIHVLGIDTKNPIFQLDDTFFTGTIENPLGTYMFFEDDPSPHCADPLFDKLPEKNLKYLCKTRKLISVEHAYVTHKEGKPETDHPVEAADSSLNDEIKPADFKTIQEAIEKFKKEWSSNTSQ
ncbi:general transcription factor 3C polypeptide 6 [Vanessa cardui]|uniref:general transcription factor 3C polypeptide 6 n=1 Tax=Vanessa cardui TaxID=171605 RepID=UPI001F13E5EB|nr:general transcription factor 3C polypeptide 6 [Vanessa cardui]